MDPYLGRADWTFPVPIRYGPGRLAELPEVLSGMGARRPLVVTDRGSAGLAFVDRAVSLLGTAGLEAGLFAGISPNPLDSEVLAGRDAYRAGGHDSVVALGGGSGMDGGKAVSLVAGNDLGVWDFEEQESPPEVGGFPPLVCVPTTAGTGAETASTAMVTHTGKAMKLCVWHPRQSPATILDPELTVGLPPNLTAWTGCDALTHAIEAYSVPSLHPLCDGAAIEALRLIGQALPAALASPGDLGARGRMLVGSCLAGVSFVKGLGLVHSISHMVGAVHDTHHGLTNAVLLPAVVRFNSGEIGGKIPVMAGALGLQGDDAGALCDGLCSMLEGMEIPRGLSAIGVGTDTVPDISAKAMLDVATGTNPRKVTAEEMERLVRECVARAW